MTLFELRKSMELERHKNISAASIAKRMGISRTTYHRYEKGRGVPDLLEASIMANVFHIQLNDLVKIIQATREQSGEVS